MIKDSLELVFRLNETYSHNEATQYTEEMAGLVVRYFQPYTPENLRKIFELIALSWMGKFGPPNLASILEMIQSHNDKVSKDKEIRPGQKVARIPESTEGCMPRKIVADMFGVMGKIIKIKDKKKRAEALEAAKEAILDGQNNSTS